MKRLIVGDEVVSLSNFTLIKSFIGAGREARVYKYKDKALKLYKKKDSDIDRLTEEEAVKLSCYDTKRILLPRETIYDADTLDYEGYSLDLIENSCNKKMVEMPVSKFLSELDCIHDDIRFLSGVGVEIEDLYMGNVLYNGYIFLCDPGDYSIKRESVEGGIYNNNIYTFNHFIKKEVFSHLVHGIRRKQFIEDEFPDFSYIGDYIRSSALPGETVKSYVKRMTR